MESGENTIEGYKVGEWGWSERLYLNIRVGGLVTVVVVVSCGYYLDRYDDCNKTACCHTR